MRKVLDCIILLPLVALALSPPWNTQLDCTVNSFAWLYMITIIGFLIFWLLYLKVNVWIKLLAVYVFATCFFSKAPYMSFTMLSSFTLALFYYHACTTVRNRDLFYKAAQSIFFFNCLLIIMQLFGKDVLLNFNMPAPVVLGTIANYMILGSFCMALAPFLIVNSRLNFIPLFLVAYISQSSGTLLAISAGLGVYVWMKFKKLRVLIIAVLIIMCVFMAYKESQFKVFGKQGRFPVWKRTIELSLEHPIVGHGIATYKLLFPIYSQDLSSSEGNRMLPWDYHNTEGKGLRWSRAHNVFLQIPFEVGWVAYIIILGFIFSVVRLTLRNGSATHLAGLTVLATDMLVHFPDRMVQSICLILAFLAFCETRKKGELC